MKNKLIKQRTSKVSKFGTEGITLIALIITVIVLLILAGVTINLTLGQNGIFKTAQQAARNYTNAQDKELADLGDFNNTINNIINGGGDNNKNDIPPLGTIIKTENNINYTADGTNNIIPVPAGFSPIREEDEQGTKETGFVIRNNVDRNEFVWIPVEGMEYTYNRYDFEQQYGSYADYSEMVPDDEQTSITTYGGYYIGRYEAGIANTAERTSTDRNNDLTAEQIEETWGKALSQNSKHVYNYVTGDQAKGLAERVYTKGNDNVTSKLCSSYAWDTALKFIATKYPEYSTNSTQGNYSGSLKTTGQSTPVNNIYDMGGNVWDWTTEVYIAGDNERVLRGGHCTDSASSAPASYRIGHDSLNAADYIAFRVILFM